MTRPQEALSRALAAHAEGAFTAKPELGDAWYRGWIALRIMAAVTKGLSAESALIRVTANLSIHDRRTVLGPQATGVLNDLLNDDVDTMEFFEVLTNAIHADLALALADRSVR